MEKRINRYHTMYPLGVTPTENGAEIRIQANAEHLDLILYKKAEKEEIERIPFCAEERIGDVWMMSLSGYDFKNLEYGFEADGKWMGDPYAKALIGREVWGDLKRSEDSLRARIIDDEFDWGEDHKPEISYSEAIIYRLHVRGFTMHESANVRNKGTYAGIIEMIPYIKELGVTTVELMPITEFDEVVKDVISAEVPNGSTRLRPNGKINYWGYGSSYLYAPKASYATGNMPTEMEVKILVKELHKAGLECILELYFTGEESIVQVLDVLRYWVEVYHVDGFHLSGELPLADIAADPFLTRTKLFAKDWKTVLASGKTLRSSEEKKNLSARRKNLAIYNNEFQNDMRRFLRGDQGMVESLLKRTLENPEEFAVVNYMANTDGFTMFDMVSYNEKHNEENGEENRDGIAENWSWNCGTEGKTDDIKIRTLRERQLYNAFFMLLLSQGTPLIAAGDEFGNSQNGNNNAYCQDNEIGWVNWNQAEEHFELLQVVKEMISFRKLHKAFHMDHAAKRTDYLSLGCPDVSAHGQSAWKLETDEFRKQLGIMYWGPYQKSLEGGPEYTFYVAYNMHWGTHKLGLPRLPKGLLWRPYYDTSGGNAAVKDSLRAQIPPYTVVIFVAAPETGYFTYDLPVGEVTLVCEEGSITELLFGRVVPEHAAERGLPEDRLPILDEAYRQLQEYFTGDRKVFELPLHSEGTEFQEQVWAALRTIPYGETRSYKEIAVQIGNENASRAIGMANNRNPLPIFVPCHRVIGTDGGLVGYAGGMEIKTKLLELEKQYK